MAINIRKSLPFPLKRAIIGALLHLRKKVDFGIIGFPKCATTSIGRNIERIPGVFLPSYEIQTRDLIRFRIYKGHETEIFGIRNPNLIYERHNLTAIIDRNPDIKLILCLRNPTDWLFSFYQYRKMEIRNSKLWIKARFQSDPDSIATTFEDIIYRKKTLFGVHLERGIFADHIQFILKHCSPQQILILFLEEVSRSPMDAYRKIFDFLNLNLQFLPSVPVSANRNRNFYEPKDRYMEQLKYLDSYYNLKNKELNALLQKHWGIVNNYW